MSADNGVYIFPVASHKEGKILGYVVQEMAAVENCFYKPTHSDGYNHNFCKFENEILITKGEAREKAFRIYESCYICEYGIQILQSYYLDSDPLPM